MASAGGSDLHPQWYRNLSVNPRVRLRVETQRFEADARTLSSADKARVWPHLVDVFAPYADYQAKTQRDIPVVALRPVE